MYSREHSLLPTDRWSYLETRMIIERISIWNQARAKSEIKNEPRQISEEANSTRNHQMIIKINHMRSGIVVVLFSFQQAMPA